MIFRKVTRRIVFSTAAMLAVGFLNMSCSNEEFEGSKRTLATRSTVGAEFSDNEAPRIAWVNAGAVTDGDSIHDFYSQLKFKIEWGAGFVGTTQDIPSRVNFCTDENSVRIVKLHNKEGEYDTKDTILSKNVQWGGMGEDYMELSFSIIADHIIYYYDQMEKKNKEYVEHYVINETKTINAVVKPMNEFE